MCPTISLKIGTSPEKMYSVDDFRKSVIMSNVLDCSEIALARGTYDSGADSGGSKDPPPWLQVMNN